MKIKWLRLKRITEEMTGKTIDFTLTTKKELNGYIALVSFNQESGELFINAGKCKSTDTLLRTISHEVTHILVGDNSHDNTFTEKNAEVYKKIKIKYKG